MIITETQESGKTREYNLPDSQGDSWIDFFQWLIDKKAEPVIVSFEIQNWKKLNVRVGRTRKIEKRKNVNCFHFVIKLLSKWAWHAGSVIGE